MSSTMMSDAQGEPDSWERHWEVLDRVGLPDFTPDVLWQADVLHRAGVPQARAKEAARRAVTSAGGAGGRGGERAAQSTPGGRPPGSGAGPGRGRGLNLTPQPLRPGLAKQPLDRRPHPQSAPEAAHNLQLLHQHPGQNPYPYPHAYPHAYEQQQQQQQQHQRHQQHQQHQQQRQQSPQEWEQPQQQPAGSTDPQYASQPVPRLHLNDGAAAPAVDGGNFEDGDRTDTARTDSSLPALPASNPAAAAAAPSPSPSAPSPSPSAPSPSPHAEGSWASANGSVGGGSVASSSRGGASIVSFRVQLPTMATPSVSPVPPLSLPAMTAPPRSSQSSGFGASDGSAAEQAALLAQPSSSRLEYVTPRDATASAVSSRAPTQRQPQQQQQQQDEPQPHHAAVMWAADTQGPPAQYGMPHQHSSPRHAPTPAWRPAPGAGGSGSLSARGLPSRGSSAAASRVSHAHTPQHSLPGEVSSLGYFGSGTSLAPAGPPPKERYRGILERVGRSAAHKQKERRRTGAAAAAAGPGYLRRRPTLGAPGDAASDSDDGDDGDAAPSRLYGGLGRWAARWKEPLATHATAAEAGGGAGTDGLSLRGPQPHKHGQRGGRLHPPADSPEAHEEAAARRLGVEGHAVWQLSRALNELSRFSCLQAVNHLELEDGSALSQVDARITALQRFEKCAVGPDGRRNSVLPQPPPAFPLDAAYEYVSAAQQGVAGLEELEEVVHSMRKKLQVVVGQDTEDLRKAAAEALADMGFRSTAVPEPSASSGPASEPSNMPLTPSAFFSAAAAPPPPPTTTATTAAPPPQPTSSRRSASCTMQGMLPASAAARDQTNASLEPLSAMSSYNTPRLASGGTTASGMEYMPGTVLAAGSGTALVRTLSPRDVMPGAGIPGESQASWTTAHPAALQLQGGGPGIGPPRGAPPYKKLSGGLAAGGGGGAVLTSASGLDQAWGMLESLVIQLHDSHAVRIDMMDAMERPGGAGPGAGRAGAAGVAAVLAAAAGGGPTMRRGGRGGVAKLMKLMDKTMEFGEGGGAGGDRGGGGGGGGGMAAAAEAAAEAAVHGNAVRAAVATTLEPKHTEQALYFLAKLALMLQQDPRLPPDAGFLVAAGVDLLLGEVSWLLALLRTCSGAGSPHLAALSAALRAYESQQAHMATLRAVAERLELAAEDALDRAALSEQQLSALHTRLQRAGHDVSDMTAYVKEMERDVQKLRAKNELLEETVEELEGDMVRVEAAHQSRGATLVEAQRLADTMLEAQLGRLALRSRGVQVATEGDCSDPRALTPLLKSTAHQYYPITPCVSSRNLPSPSGKATLGRSTTTTHRKHGKSGRKGGRSTSMRPPRGGGGASVAAAAAKAMAAAEAAAASAAAGDDGNVDDVDEDWAGHADARSTDDSPARRRGRLAGMGRTVSWKDRTLPPPSSGSDDEPGAEGRGTGQVWGQPQLPPQPQGLEVAGLAGGRPGEEVLDAALEQVARAFFSDVFQQ